MCVDLRIEWNLRLHYIGKIWENDTVSSTRKIHVSKALASWTKHPINMSEFSHDTTLMAEFPILACG